MDFGKFRFGSLEIDGVTYEGDVVINRGKVRRRKKKPSQKFRDKFGHTPISVCIPHEKDGMIGEVEVTK